MEPREVQGRTAPLFFSGAIRPVLYDTTQLALERTIAGASQRHNGALERKLGGVKQHGTDSS